MRGTLQEAANLTEDIGVRRGHEDCSGLLYSGRHRHEEHPEHTQSSAVRQPLPDLIESRELTPHFDFTTNGFVFP